MEKSTKQREIFARVLTSHKARITRIVPVRLEYGCVLFFMHTVFFLLSILHYEHSCEY